MMYTNEPAQVAVPENIPVFSTVTVERVDATGFGDELESLSASPDVLPPQADPNGLVPDGDDVVIVAIHALDPPVGGEVGGSDQPGDPDFFDSIIGLTLRSAGLHEDVEVPIYPIDIGLETLGARIPPGGTFPPNPGDDTEVLAQLWTPSVGEEEGSKPTPYDTGARILTVDGGPVRDGATVTALDQNDALDPIPSPPDEIVAASDGASSW